MQVFHRIITVVLSTHHRSRHNSISCGAATDSRARFLLRLRVDLARVVTMSDWPSYGESSRRTRDRPDASKQPAGDVGDGDDTDLFRELRSLQAQAQALNTHNGEDGVPSVKRDFDQLLQGSLAMVRTGLARAGGGEGDDAGGRTSPTHNAGLLRLGDGSGTGAGTGSGQFDDGFVPTELVTKQISSNAYVHCVLGHLACACGGCMSHAHARGCFEQHPAAGPHQL